MNEHQYKPFCQASENNKQPILSVLEGYLTEPADLLEIGSGTGQHAVFFSERLPHINWQPSDLRDKHAGMTAWFDEVRLDNLLPPLELDVTQWWPSKKYDSFYSANTAHIMSWVMVQQMFRGISQCINQQGYFFLYGPFNVGGEYTSQGNQQFDQHLRRESPDMGIRNLEEMIALAESHQFKLEQRHAMPSNNFLLVWQASASA